MEIIWEIPEEDLRCSSLVANDRILTSPSVSLSGIPGATCKLQLSSSNRQRRFESPGFVLATLVVTQKEGHEVRVFGALFIHSANFFHRFSPRRVEASGYEQQLFPNATLFFPTSNYIVKEKLTIKFGGIVEIRKSRNSSVAPPMELWESGHKDFTILVGKNEIQVSYFFSTLCHKAFVELKKICILASYRFTSVFSQPGPPILRPCLNRI